MPEDEKILMKAVTILTLSTEASAEVETILTLSTESSAEVETILTPSTEASAEVETIPNYIELPIRARRLTTEEFNLQISNNLKQHETILKQYETT